MGRCERPRAQEDLLFPRRRRHDRQGRSGELPALLADERVVRARYVGRAGWITTTLGARPDWGEVEELITTSYCLIAPKTLARTVTR
jgi:hypothetical protein